MNTLETVEGALDTAQTELAGAEIALLEATARAGDARKEASRLEAAVAALRGESPPATPSNVPLHGADSDSKPDNGGSTPSRAANQELTAEEFDKDRKRRQRKREKEIQENNPLAHVKCAGCGELGSMVDTIQQAPSGATVRMMVCSCCNNQIMT